MEKKYLIATHGRLAEGLQSSIGILAGKADKVEVINAYVDDSDYTQTVKDFVASITDDMQGIVFTDIFGGSVNQKVVAEVMTQKKDNVLVVSNSNLPVVLTVLLTESDEAFTEEDIKQAIRDSTPVLVPTKITTDDDEDDFF